MTASGTRRRPAAGQPPRSARASHWDSDPARRGRARGGDPAAASVDGMSLGCAVPRSAPRAGHRHEPDGRPLVRARQAWTPNVRADATKRRSRRSPLRRVGRVVSGLAASSRTSGAHRFMPMASARCASGTAHRGDIAVDTKRLRISTAGSTSSSGIGVPVRSASRSRGAGGSRAATACPKRHTPRVCRAFTRSAWPAPAVATSRDPRRRGVRHAPWSGHPPRRRLPMGGPVARQDVLAISANPIPPIVETVPLSSGRSPRRPSPRARRSGRRSRRRVSRCPSSKGS